MRPIDFAIVWLLLAGSMEIGMGEAIMMLRAGTWIIMLGVWIVLASITFGNMPETDYGNPVTRRMCSVGFIVCLIGAIVLALSYR